VGCARQEDPAAATAATETASALPAQTTAPSPAAEETVHGHVPGAHGGIIVAIGRDNYHAEAIFESGGKLRLFMLGNDETQVQEIDAQELTAYVTLAGRAASTAVTLRPEPQSGDSEGKTSQFVADLPEGLAGQAVEVTIPSVRIGVARFRIAFTSAVEAHEDPMPDKVDDAKERELYLTPGGIYTEADIEANGRLTASERFVAFRAKHDLHPQPGEKICPVTLTKANPACAWIIGGKTYEFCCPPCVDEFVKLAKEHPDAVQAPEKYVK
jgi:YHS domain-containing protein